MQIWIDADACPKVIKGILFRAAERAKLTTTVVANQSLQIPFSAFIQKVQVASGFDVADHYIIDHVQKGDLVITSDIPLADAVIAKGCVALNPRGELYTHDNIKQQLSVRNFNADLRSAGMMSGGPSTLSNKDIQQFANRLDQIIQQRKLSC